MQHLLVVFSFILAFGGGLYVGALEQKNEHAKYVIQEQKAQLELKEKIQQLTKEREETRKSHESETASIRNQLANRNAAYDKLLKQSAVWKSRASRADKCSNTGIAVSCLETLADTTRASGESIAIIQYCRKMLEDRK